MAKAGRARKGAGSSLADIGLVRVLIVEDDPVLAMSTEDILRDCGVETIDVCPTTEAALASLRDQMPDAIILDVHLADRDDGWAVAELVESLGENRPRIVFATGAPQDIPPQIAGLGSVLEKPYLPEDLIAALRGAERKSLFARLRGNV